MKTTLNYQDLDSRSHCFPAVMCWAKWCVLSAWVFSSSKMDTIRVNTSPRFGELNEVMQTEPCEILVFLWGHWVGHSGTSLFSQQSGGWRRGSLKLSDCRLAWVIEQAPVSATLTIGENSHYKRSSFEFFISVDMVTAPPNFSFLI